MENHHGDENFPNVNVQEEPAYTSSAANEEHGDPSKKPVAPPSLHTNSVQTTLRSSMALATIGAGTHTCAKR
jgi:hypothetical protein